MDAINTIARALPSIQSQKTEGAGTRSRELAKDYGGDSIREVKSFAANTDLRQTPAERRGLAQLSETLVQGAEPRRDVPRGFYLNIVV